MLHLLELTLGISVVLNGVMFGAAYAARSDKLTDISYAATFAGIAVTIFLHGGKTLYHTLVLCLVMAWAVRIGGFLLYRVIKTGKDRRFDGVREHFWQFGRFWLGQAITVWVLMLPVTLLSRAGSWNAAVWIGIAAYLTGLCLEAIADQQKYHFSRTSGPNHKWIDTGLWHYARHPNYFGEILVWVGVYLYCLPGLDMAGKLVGLISPLAISVLLLFVSGVPPLEKSAEKRWGSEAGYQRYKRRTRLLVPLPKRG